MSWPLPTMDEPLVVGPPTTWLLAEGWKRVGAISAWAVPGTKARAAKSR